MGLWNSNQGTSSRGSFLDSRCSSSPSSNKSARFFFPSFSRGVFSSPSFRSPQRPHWSWPLIRRLFILKKAPREGRIARWKAAPLKKWCWRTPWWKTEELQVLSSGSAPWGKGLPGHLRASVRVSDPKQRQWRPGLSWVSWRKSR